MVAPKSGDALKNASDTSPSPVKNLVHDDIVFIFHLSEQQLQLHPHAADAAVGEIAIQKAGRQPWCGTRGGHALFWNLSELRMVQGIQSLPAKLQPLLLSDLEGLGKAHVKVVDATGHQCVATYCEGIGRSNPLDPANVSRGDAHTSESIWVKNAS